MEQREIERAIGELEERVDRLRVLYEQYFLGYEKLEPTVPRKDVERRFAILRKENMRNTAIRFRFNVVTQKYNTYAMHWTRICRQIEEGTYKRHVRRAKERFGDAAPGRELDRDRDRAAAEPSFDVELDFAELDGADVDALLKEADGAVFVAPSPPPPPPAAIPPPVPPAGAPDRVARPAAMPTGARPTLIRKVVKAPDPGGAPAPGAGASSGHVPSAPAPSSTRALPSAPRIGVPASGAPARPMIRPVRPPSPSAPDLGPSSKPRLPLPSQIGRERDEKE